MRPKDHFDYRDDDDHDDDDDETFSRKITGKESRVVECVPEIRGVFVSSWVMDTIIFHDDKHYKTKLLVNGCYHSVGSPSIRRRKKKSASLKDTLAQNFHRPT